MSEQLDDMYREVIMDHFRAPRGKDPLPQFDIQSKGANPSCGDNLEMEVSVGDGKVRTSTSAARAVPYPWLPDQCWPKS